MKPENKQFLEANRFYVESYKQQDPPRKMSMRDREKLLKIINEEFNAGLTPDLWCDPCVKTFVLNAYQIYDSSQL